MRKSLPFILSAVTLCILAHAAGAHNRMDRVLWTDRSITNPPLVDTRSIQENINQFWNVALTEERTRPAQGSVGRSSPVCNPACPKSGNQVQQDRKTRERRGFFGINLFNAIPLIDFVHGSVTTDSSDHVEGRR